MALIDYRIPQPLMSPEITSAIEDRFWSKVDRSPGQGPKGECWSWKAGLIPAQGNSIGYPRGFGIGGSSFRPSHIALAISGLPRPNGEM